MSSVIRVEGLRNATRQLERLGVQAEDLKGAFSKIGARAVPTARAYAPKKSGTLAGSIRHSQRKNSLVVMAGRKSIPYAGPIHFGWPKRNIQAQPFLFYARDQLGPWSVDTIQKELNDLIRKLGF